MPGTGENILADVAKNYFIERRGIDISGGQPEALNHAVGLTTVPNTLSDYQTVITSPYYFLRYLHYSPLTVPTATLEADANTEDMTVIRLTRDDIVGHCMDFFALESFQWNEVVWDPIDTQAEVDQINTDALALVITDGDLNRFKLMRDDSDALFASLASITDQTFDYDGIQWDNPGWMLARLFPDPNVPTDTVPLRKTILTDATKLVIEANNDLTNRINQLFV